MQSPVQKFKATFHGCNSIHGLIIDHRCHSNVNCFVMRFIGDVTDQVLLACYVTLHNLAVCVLHALFAYLCKLYTHLLQSKGHNKHTHTHHHERLLSMLLSMLREGEFGTCGSNKGKRGNTHVHTHAALKGKLLNWLPIHSFVVKGNL